jgi:hypothetical protein
MSSQTLERVVVDGTTIKVRESGEIYADHTVLAEAIDGDALVLSGVNTVTGTTTFNGTSLQIKDAVDGKTYTITLENGVLTPVEV